MMINRKHDILPVTADFGRDDHAVEPVMLPCLTEAGLHDEGDTRQRKALFTALDQCGGEHGTPDLHADMWKIYLYDKRRRKRCFTAVLRERLGGQDKRPVPFGTKLLSAHRFLRDVRVFGWDAVFAQGFETKEILPGHEPFWAKKASFGGFSIFRPKGAF